MDEKKVNLGNKPVPKKTGKPAGKFEKPMAKSDKPAAKVNKPVAKANKPAETKPVKDVDVRGNAVTKKPANKGKYGKAKPEQKPWEKMTKGAAAKGAATKAAPKKETKPVKEMRDFLYLVPKRTSAKSFAEALKFIDPKSLEVWEDECVIEITAQGVITFEDIRESLEKEDKEVLNDLRMKQVISCDYESTDAELVQKIMTTFLKEFGGKIASDTEDFTPFLEPKDL